MKSGSPLLSSRTLAWVSLAAAVAFAAVLWHGRDSAFSARLLAWNNGGWPDAVFDGTYPAARSFRALLGTFFSLALLWPLSRLLSRKGMPPVRAAETALLLGALLLGTLLRSDLWWTKSFWIDSYSLKAGLRTLSFPELFSEPLGFGQSAPVGFCFFEKCIGGWSGWNDRALTFPLFLAGLAVLVLLPLAVARAGAPRLAAPAALLAAVSPQLVYYSAEFKQYGFDALFAVLALLAALELGAGRRPRPLLAAVFLAGPFLSHTQFFLLPGLGLVLFLSVLRSGGAWHRPSRSGWADLLLFGGLGGIVVLASHAHTAATMPGIMDTFWAPAFPPRGSVPAFLAWWGERALLFFRDPFAVLPVPSAVSPLRVALFLPVPALLLAGMASRNRPVAAVSLLSVSALALLVFASSLGKWPVRTGTDSVIESRHLLFLLPFAFFFLALGLDRLRARCFPLALALVVAAVPVEFSRLLTDRIYSWSMPDAVAELARRAGGSEPILLGGYHHAVACAYAQDWFSLNESRIEVLRADDPSAFAARLDELAPGTAFWTLWAPRGKEGRILPGIFANHLPGRHADFSEKTPAGILQHFPAPPPSPPSP
jgi:hypothetical protein